MSLALLQQYASDSSEDDDEATSQPPITTPTPTSTSKPKSTAEPAPLEPTPTSNAPTPPAQAKQPPACKPPQSTSSCVPAAIETLPCDDHPPIDKPADNKPVHLPSNKATRRPHPRRRRQQQQQQKQKQKQQPQRPRPRQSAINTDLPADLPADLAAELMRAGHTSATISIETIDARPSSTPYMPQHHPNAISVSAVATATTATTAPTSSSSSSVVAPPSTPQGQRLGHGHVPASVVHKTAERISKRHDVTRKERRKHQITALAADAAALQTARLTFPHAGRPPARRRGHKS